MVIAKVQMQFVELDASHQVNYLFQRVHAEEMAANVYQQSSIADLELILDVAIFATDGFLRKVKA